MTSTSTTSIPSIGTRLIYSGHFATVRYVGEVDKTQGRWLGVEWDEEGRGKHDGTKDGKRYFHCLVPNAGSFIRPSQSIIYGQTFLQALISKYVEVHLGDGNVEKVLLGSSNGAIEVEAVGLDKVRSKISRLERLREVSLDTENVAAADLPGQIRSTCPNIRGLDLSQSLLPSWSVVAAIASEIPFLERLSLNRNRFEPLSRTFHAPVLESIQELQLNRTNMTWKELSNLLPSIPNLRQLEFGYNRLQTLITAGPHADAVFSATTLELVNLDGNILHDWYDICNAFRYQKSTRNLILTSNCLRSIPPPRTSDSPLHHLKHLALSLNLLSTWTDFDHLNQWLPSLETLSVNGIPILQEPQAGQYSRQLIVAKMPSLLALNSSSISPKERQDCELFYLSYIVQHAPHTDGPRTKEHPQWTRLCELHGSPIEAPRADQSSDTLSSRLITVNIELLSCEPTDGAQGIDRVESFVALRVLSTMSLRAFQMKASKSLRSAGASMSQGLMRMWMKTEDGLFIELATERNSRDISWCGIEDGTTVYVSLGTT